MARNGGVDLPRWADHAAAAVAGPPQVAPQLQRLFPLARAAAAAARRRPGAFGISSRPRLSPRRGTLLSCARRGPVSRARLRLQVPRGQQRARAKRLLTTWLLALPRSRCTTLGVALPWTTPTPPSPIATGEGTTRRRRRLLRWRWKRQSSLPQINRRLFFFSGDNSTHTLVCQDLV